MISVFLREQKRYTQEDLVKEFHCSEEKTVRILKRLKEYGVLKAVKANDTQKDLTDLLDEDIEIADVEVGENEYLYVFTFVGVITIEGRVLKCYPKYLLDATTPKAELKRVLKVLEKYNSKEQIIRMYNDTSDSSAFNMLAVMLFLLQDYFEYGAYTNTQDIIESNGSGDILWDKTINETFTLLSNNRPYYPVLLTMKRVNDDFDFFKRLHECILTRCTEELRDADPLKTDSELYLVIYAGFAQSESESISKNITWSVRKKFEEGTPVFIYKRFLGYKKGADGEPEIVPSEAAIVERIFNLYLAGETVDNISKMMQAENYDIPGKTISFSKGMIMNMLSNERYCGDAILQKSVTVDCIEKKRKKNTGEAPMYYVQNNHPAIIDRVTFNKVQEELARRKTKTPGSAKSSITSTGKYSRYALTDVLICGNCGTRYRRVTWSRNGTKRIVWRCISRLDYGKKYCSDSPTIMEDKLQEAIVRAVNKFNKQDNATYKALMRATISEALGLNGDPEEVDMLERKIEALNNKMLALVNESVSSGDGIEAHESEFMTLSQEAELLKQRIAAIQESTAKDNGEQNRLEQIQAIIAERESKCMEYDDSIVRQMVECIKVYPGGKLEIIFGGGYLVEESV